MYPPVGGRPGPTANWAYARALLAFRREGPGRAAAQLLAAARTTNSRVLAYLLGRKRIPARLPDAIGPGALDWLAKSV